MSKNCIYCFESLPENGVCVRCGFNNVTYKSEPHHLPPETILHGRYVVGKALGEGGFGITYAGYDLVLMRRVAIKEFFPSGAVWRDPSTSLDVSCFTSKNLREAFELGRQKCIHEAQSLAKLDDIPAIVRILDFFSENQTAYIIMEFVEGVTLKEYVRRLSKKLTLQEIIQLLMPVADALDKVHKRGFVHRDISPDNIMIMQDKTAKLLDFGAVKSVTSGGSATEHPIVKRGFSPLELYSTEGLIGAWTDVYALAATIFFLLTGTTLDEPSDRMIHDSAAEKLRGILSQMQMNALLRALSIQPRDRQESVSALMDDLQSAEPDIGCNNTIRSKPTIWQTVSRKPKLLAPIAAVLGIVIICAVVGIVNSDGKRSTKTQLSITDTSQTTTTTSTKDSTVTHPMANGNQQAQYPAAFFVETPSVTHNATPDYSNGRVYVYLPKGFVDIHEEKANAGWAAADVMFVRYADEQAEEAIMVSTMTIDDDAYVSTDKANEVFEAKGMSIDALVASLKLQEYKKASSDAGNDAQYSDLYQMKIGDQVWFCYDSFENDVYASDAFGYFGNRVNRVTSYSRTSKDCARELLYNNVDTNTDASMTTVKTTKSTTSAPTSTTTATAAAPTKTPSATAAAKKTRIVCDPQSLTVRKGFSKKMTARFYGYDSVSVQHGEGSYGMEVTSSGWEGDCYVVTVKVKGNAAGSGSVDFVLKLDAEEELYHYPITIQ